MTGDLFYDLQEPTAWAQPPQTYSFSSLQSLRTCPRRWQLTHSAWGQHASFPERPQPAAIEGRIIHQALDLLARELGRHGRPPIASAAFRESVDRCGFWPFFATQVDIWNRRLAAHPRAGPRDVLRSKPRDLANQAISLFRDRYQTSDRSPRMNVSPIREAKGTTRTRRRWCFCRHVVRYPRSDSITRHSRWCACWTS